MRKRIIFIFAVVIIGIGGHYFSARAVDKNQIQSTHAELKDFSVLLNALVPVFPEGSVNEFNREALLNRRQEERTAAEKIRQLGTNILPQLMEKVRLVGQVESTNRTASLDDTRRIARAFEILGSDATPLLPSLIKELQSGRSIGPSIAGLVSIGGTKAGLALVSELTNSDPVIRNWTMSVLSGFSTNRDVALAAVPLLLERLGDDSEFSRSLAASVLGYMNTNPKTVLPALVHVAEKDRDIVARCMAIKAIGHFGTNAISVRSNVENITRTEQDKQIKRISLLALKAIDGQISGEDVQ